MYCHAEFGRSTSNVVNINRGDAKIGERWGTATVGIGDMVDPKSHTLPHMCSLAERGIGERWGTATVGIGDMVDPKSHTLPHMCSLAERGRSALMYAILAIIQSKNTDVSICTYLHLYELGLLCSFSH